MLGEYLYGKIILAVFMVICAIMDLRKKSIREEVFAGMLMLSVTGYVWMIITGKEILWRRILIGAAAGAFIAVLSLVTGRNIGMGDAIYFGLAGLVMCCKNVLFFAGSVLLSAIISIVICVIGIIRGEGIKNKSLPFLAIAFPIGIAIVFFSKELGLE